MRNDLCTDCKFHEGCRTVCLTAKPKEAPLMIIIDNAAESDDSNGSIMASKKDSMIFSILESVIHADFDLIHKSYAIKCRPRDGEKIGQKEITACRKYLLEEIEEVRPKAILVVGDTPLKMVLGLSGISKERGKVHEVAYRYADGEEVTIKCVPIFAPGYVQHNYSQQLIKQYAEDIDRAYSLAIGVEDIRSTTHITQVETIEQVHELVRYIKQVGRVSFDYETTEVDDEGLGVFDPEFKVTLISAAFQQGGAWTIPMQHEESPFTEEEREEIWQIWNTEVLEDENIDKIAHNAKYEMLVSKRFGCVKIRGRLDDTMLMHHNLYEYAERHGLKPIVDELFPQFSGYNDPVAASAKKVGWEKVPMKILSPYGGTDADLTLRIRDRFEAELLKDMRSYRVYRNLTMYAIRALFRAEWQGMPIDKQIMLSNIARAEELLKKQEDILRNYKQVKNFEKVVSQQVNEAKIVELEGKLVKAKGKRAEEYLRVINEIKLGMVSYYNKNSDNGLNFGSPKQLGDLIYEPHGFNYPKVYDRKKRQESKSTDKKILNQMNDKYGFFEDLRLWRSVSKTLSTYLLGVYNRLDKNCRVHTSFLLHGTESGRLSSRNPNLQNLPNISKLTSEIAIEVITMVKKAFVPPPDGIIAQYDYKQAELKIIAEFAGEENMINAYANGQDLHAITGAKFKEMTLEEFMALPKEEFKKARFEAKAGNFGIIYLISPEGFVDYALNSYGVKISIGTSEKWIEAFFELYPKIREYHAIYIEKAKKFGYVRSLFGRKRHTREIHNPDGYIRAFDERVAVNDPVQATAGEFTIFAAALLADRLPPDVPLANTIHDSLIFFHKKDRFARESKLIKSTMENLPTKKYFGRELERVKMEVDIECSDVCWKEMKPYEENK